MLFSRAQRFRFEQIVEYMVRFQRAQVIYTRKETIVQGNMDAFIQQHLLGFQFARDACVQPNTQNLLTRCQGDQSHHARAQGC